MLLRRVIEHVKTQNWTAVALDFVIVVVGVFIGIQVANWNQFAGDRRAETEYLVQLHGDLQNIKVEIAAQIEFEQFHANLASEVFDLVRDDASGDRALKINIGLSELAARRTLRTQSPTFLDLQGSGKLELISDPALRTAIISYFYRTSRLEAAIDKNNAFFIDQAYCNFVLSMNIPSRTWDSGLMNMQLPPSAKAPSAFRKTAIKGPLYAAGGAVLTAPLDDEIWDAIVSRLAWRGSISAINEAHAQQLSAATEELEARLARRLGRAQ